MLDTIPTLRLWGVPELVAHRVEVFVPERRFQLLAWLALRSGEWLGRDQAAALLWPHHDLTSARRNLRKVLQDSRAVPGVTGLDFNDHALRWTVPSDIRAFDAGLQATPPRHGPMHSRCAEGSRWRGSTSRQTLCGPIGYRPNGRVWTHAGSA